MKRQQQQHCWSLLRQVLDVRHNKVSTVRYVTRNKYADIVWKVTKEMADCYCVILLVDDWFSNI